MNLRDLMNQVDECIATDAALRQEYEALLEFAKWMAKEQSQIVGQFIPEDMVRYYYATTGCY